MPKTSIAILAKAPVAGLRQNAAHSGDRRARGGGAAGAPDRARGRNSGRGRFGPVTLWCAPDPSHPSFRDLVVRHGVALKRQPDGDLGARMLGAFAPGPTLVIGTDCPAFTVGHLRAAAASAATTPTSC